MITDELFSSIVKYADGAKTIVKNDVGRMISLDQFEPYLGRSRLVWKDVADLFAKCEHEYSVQFKLRESSKLYAMDALMVLDPLGISDDKKRSIASVFTVFYLVTHFYDDHVEHREKFYGKFAFSNIVDTHSQEGAAPFSFLLMAHKVIQDLLNEIDATSDQRTAIADMFNGYLLGFTSHLTVERQGDLSVDRVLADKQREVAGKALAFVAELVNIVDPLGDLNKERALRDGLLYLGSLTQITDDIRDASTDDSLGNANILNAAIREYGQEQAGSVLSKIYKEEEHNVATCLAGLYTDEQINNLLTLPLYPFLIEKK